MAQSDCTIREAYESETEDIVSLITDNFWSNNPVFERYASVLKNRHPGGVEEFMKNKSELARHKVSDLTHKLVVIHKQSNKIVGHLGLSVYEKNVGIEAISDESSNTKPVFKSRIIAEYQAYLEPRIKESNIHKLYPQAKNFMSLGVMTVDLDHRGKGLSEKLLRESLEWAKRNGIQVVHGAFASSHSQRPAAKIGLKTLKDYDLRDFRDSNGIQVFADAIPNEPVTIMAVTVAEF